jgi:hypothetical protein
MSTVKPADIKSPNLAVAAATVGVVLVGGLLWKRMKNRKTK